VVEAKFPSPIEKIIILISTRRREFLQDFEQSRPESRRGASPDSFFSLFQTCSRTINQSGNGKVCSIKTKASLTRNSISRSSRHCGTVAFLLIPLVVACFALSPTAQAVDPPPEGGYPGQNTAEGEDALFNLSTGTDNTALDFEALFDTTIASGNTAVGSQALSNNIN
jgi:hypothetical protein